MTSKRTYFLPGETRSDSLQCCYCGEVIPVKGTHFSPLRVLGRAAGIAAILMLVPLSPVCLWAGATIMEKGLRESWPSLSLVTAVVCLGSYAWYMLTLRGKVECEIVGISALEARKHIIECKR